MEEWRPLRETALYEASSYGRIRIAKTGEILKGTKTSRRRIRVLLKINGKHYARYVNRLVGEAFWGAACDGFDIYHKDADTTNNRLDNLVIGTRSEAIRNYYKHKHQNENRKEY